MIGLYRHPPEKAVVLCLHEKSQIQALGRTQPLLPMRPRQVERRTHDYVRHGTATLFTAFDVATGTVIGRIYSATCTRSSCAFCKHSTRAIPAANCTWC